MKDKGPTARPANQTPHKHSGSVPCSHRFRLSASVKKCDACDPFAHSKTMADFVIQMLIKCFCRTSRTTSFPCIIGIKTGSVATRNQARRHRCPPGPNRKGCTEVKARVCRLLTPHRTTATRAALPCRAPDPQPPLSTTAGRQPVSTNTTYAGRAERSVARRCSFCLLGPCRSPCGGGKVQRANAVSARRSVAPICAAAAPCFRTGPAASTPDVASATTASAAAYPASRILLKGKNHDSLPFSKSTFFARGGWDTWGVFRQTSRGSPSRPKLLSQPGRTYRFAPRSARRYTLNVFRAGLLARYRTQAP